MMMKHPIEAKDSWALHVQRERQRKDSEQLHRSLKKKHHHGNGPPIEDGDSLEYEKEREYWKQQQELEEEKAKEHQSRADKFAAHIHDLYEDPGIVDGMVHGMMIDAGSKGSRIHLYEWMPRVLKDTEDIEDAVSGRKISFPTSETRWTDRIEPGVDEFAYLSDDEMIPALSQYLSQFVEFAKTILHDQEDHWITFPIYWRATGGMRIVDTKNRARVVKAVRALFANETFCPFYFVDEQARVISGEEEAIFDWTNVNFLLNVLLPESEGAGTVRDPTLTYGALDLGGASTQISYFEPNEDIMANLFKLQIGEGKHWNLYAHSFLHYGVLESQRRFESRLADGHSSAERLKDGIYNPCLPGGTTKEMRTNIHFNKTTGLETYQYTEEYASGNGFYNAVLRNGNETGNFELCMKQTKALLNLQQNDWCDFSHNGECSFAGVYQPDVPTQAEGVGEFLAFSNYRHVWDFLRLEEKSTLTQLHDAAKYACSMNEKEYLAFANGTVKDEEALDYCFRSVYVFHLLRNGYGFKMDDNITSVDVIDGKKVGWALGAMLYEINTMPWTYESHEHELPIFEHQAIAEDRVLVLFIILSFVGMGTSMFLFFKLRQANRKSQGYERVP